MAAVAKALGNGIWTYEWMEPECPAPLENGWAHDLIDNWE